MKAIKLDKQFESPLDRFLERACAVVQWSKLVVVLGACGAFLWFLFFGGGGPFIDRTITRYRLAGVWDVRGTLVDWRFGSDGTFREEGIISTEGSYQLLDGDRIRIVGALGLPTVYRYRFDGQGLLLTGESAPFEFRLTAKD